MSGYCQLCLEVFPRASKLLIPDCLILVLIEFYGQFLTHLSDFEDNTMDFEIFVEFLVNRTWLVLADTSPVVRHWSEVHPDQPE